MKCEICNILFKSPLSLSIHINFKHKNYGVKGYYDLFLKKEGEDCCQLEECISKTTFITINRGYGKFCCREHSSKSLDWKNQVSLTWKNKSKSECEKITSKRKKTCLEKYGDENYATTKSREILKEKYGVENISQLDGFKEKTRNTWKNKSSKELCIINKKKRKTTFERFGVEHIMYDEETVKKISKKTRKKREELGHYLPESEMPLFEIYRNRVHVMTKKNKKEKFSKEDLDKIGKCGIKGALQVDHKYSIKQGFIDNIPPYIIAHKVNLCLLAWEENDNKKDKCTITKGELFESIFKDYTRLAKMEKEAGIED